MVSNQMGMPAAAPAPEEMAVFDQMRQNISPKEFSDEMLAGASQADPQAVAQFRAELDKLDVPPEVLDALNNLVDEILANPEQYDVIRQKYMDQGIPEDILPEQFDPHFFAALNMAVDQMIAAPAGEQAFAKGGIAELKPIHKAIASYGRNGDTMLAHITPAEARMLKRKGGAGTTNPKTGLPEFFSLGSMFKSLGNAVKSFASSSVGRIVTTVALGMILGPAAAAAMSAEGAAAAAISGFVGGAGSTLLAGGNLRDALKAGAISGVMAGAGSALMGPSAAAAPKADVPVVDLSTPAAPPVAATPGITPESLTTAPPTATTTAPVAPGGEAVSATQAPGGAPTPPPTTVAPPVTFPDATATEGSLAKALTPTGSTSLLDQAKDFYTNNLSPSGIRAAAEPAAHQAGVDAMEAMKARLPNATPEMLDKAYQSAKAAAMPGVLGSYGPIVGAGLGIMGLTGGFSAKQPPASALKSQLMKPATQRIAEEGTGRQYYVQGLPGVQYDASGAPIYGSASPLPTTGLPNYGGGFAMPGTIGGLASLTPPAAMYATPPGSIGSRQVTQPYNTADMYSNLIYPRRYASGGVVTDMFRSTLGRSPTSAEISTWKERFGDDIDESEMAKFREDQGVAAELAKQQSLSATQAAEQRASREEIGRQKALRKAAGSAGMYANINAGLAARAPEYNPRNPADTGFGARNRQAALDSLQQTYGPMLARQRAALDQQAGIAASGQLPRNLTGYSAQDKAELYRGLARQGLTDPQIRAAAENRYGFQSDQDWQGLQNAVGRTEHTMPAVPPPTFFNYGPMPGVAGVTSGPITLGPVSGPPAAGGTGTPTTPAPVTLPGTVAGMTVQDKVDLYNKMLTQPGATDASVRAAAEAAYGPQTDADWNYLRNQAGTVKTIDMTTPAPVIPAPVTPVPAVTPTYNLPSSLSGYSAADKASLYSGLMAQPGATDAQIRAAAEAAYGPQTDADWAALRQLAATAAPNLGVLPGAQVGPPKLLNMGGIAALAQGGYPRMNGQISGPGTEKSDSIPAMLSDGEFVMTAKAVRGAGKGNRREGAKKMYQLMHRLERNAQRG